MVGCRCLFYIQYVPVNPQAPDLTSPSPLTSLMAQMVKYVPVMQETWVQSLDRENPLEKGTATHSSILAWRIPWTEKPDGLQFMGLQRVGRD